MAGAAIALLAVLVLAAVAVPDVLSTPREDIRPSDVTLRSDAPPDVVSVRGDTVTLRIDTRLLHRGGESENVSLEVRAVDAETGLLGDRVLREVGTISGDEETRVLTNLTLDREGGYRIDTVLFADGQRVDSGSREIGGVGTLTPAYAKSPIQFQRFAGQGADLPTITYAIENVTDERATLRVAAALTNTGSAGAGDVDLRLRARQADSNVIADKRTISVGEIRPGRTVTPTAELTVPDGYNYWLDAMIVTEGVVVATAVEPANLDPEKTLEDDRTRRDVQFESGDFTRGEDRADREPERTARTEEAGPGFGLAVAIVAVLAAVVLGRFRTRS